VKGGYILLVRLAAGKDILIGRLGYIPFPKASYAYVGSAMNGFKARLAHHLREEKKFHWHIDYLLKEAEIEEIILCQAEKRVECTLAQALAGEFQSISGFGASGNLYFADEKDRLKAKVVEAVKQAGLAHKIFSRMFNCHPAPERIEGEEA